MNQRHFSSIVLFLTCAFFLFLIRWPGWTTPYSLNLDEELILASVVTMQSRGVIPWVDFDTTTIGPVTSWFLYCVVLLFGQLDYQSIHVLSAILWALMGTICVLLVFLLTSWRGALVSFFIVSVTWFMTLRFDYLHFNSGIVPSLLLSLGALSLFLARDYAQGTRLKCFLIALCGLLCSLSVLGKLQAAPIALLVFAGACWLSIFEIKVRKTATVFSLIFATVFVPAVLVLYLVSIGEFGTAWNSYVVAGLSYGSGQVLDGARLTSLRQDIWNGWAFFRPFFITIALILIACPSSRPTRMKHQQSLDWLFLFGWLIAALFAVVTPAARWEHHGTFLVAPAIVFLSYLIFSATKGEAASVAQWKVSLTLGTLSVVWLGFCSPHLESVNLKHHLSVTGPSAWHRSLFQRIATESKGGKVAVWGWVPAAFADTNLPSATRHMISHFLIDESPAREGLRESYIKDLKENPPTVFLDAVCDGFFLWGWSDHPHRRADSFPELHDFLSKYYHKTVTDTYPAHLYFLKDQFRKQDETQTSERPMTDDTK